FARYRIERGTGGEDPVEIGVVDGPPFLDATAEEGVRYLYRITGEDAGGVRGLPATIEGTRRSRGVVSGVAEMNRTGARGFDFLLGTPVEDGDVALTGIFGDWDGASFVDSLGREIRPLAATHGDPRVAWDEESEASSQIPAGSSFLVPLPGGGVARCRLEIPAQDRREERVEAILHYEACGDGGVLPQPARLSAKRGETGAIVTVEVKPPYRVEQVEVTDLVTGEALAPLPVADGVARDAGAGEGQVRRYRAVPVDAHGRRASAATATIALLPDGPRAGEFRFHYQQGFDLETGRIVDAGEADVFFQECRGGISQITLAAPGGIVSMERVLPKHLNPGRAEAIYDLVVSADPQVALAARAEADSRTPSSDVFLVRTRHGGWAKLAITHRASEGTWMKFLATVKYVFNGQEPVFAQDQGEELGGVRFRDLQRLQARAAILRDWQQGWHRIAQDPLRRQALEEEIREEGEMPDAEATQEVLWSRQRHKDYEKATYSFIFATRDDPGLGRTRNDWCLQYGNGGDMLDVRMVTDDLSTITDLGPGDWALLARRAAIQERETDRTPARFGHIYLVHTLDTDENFFALLRVTALRPGDRVAFEWVARRGDGLTRSPGLALDAPTEKALAALLAQLPETPEKRWEGRDHARAVQQRLQEPEVLIGVVDAAPEAFLRDLSEIAGVRIVLKGRQAGPVTVFGARMTPERILDSVADKTGLRWRIEEDGSVSLE
ncbi:MAG: hypothetical protein L6Q95_18245, partial [Planctomycetes bacterium]|nr:hypothetical protein [Planctomycetota bacterium]